MPANKFPEARMSLCALLHKGVANFKMGKLGRSGGTFRGLRRDVGRCVQLRGAAARVRAANGLRGRNFLAAI